MAAKKEPEPVEKIYRVTTFPVLHPTTLKVVIPSMIVRVRGMSAGFIETAADGSVHLSIFDARGKIVWSFDSGFCGPIVDEAALLSEEIIEPQPAKRTGLLRNVT